MTASVVKALNSHEVPERLTEHAFDGWGEDTFVFELGAAAARGLKQGLRDGAKRAAVRLKGGSRVVDFTYSV